MNLLSEYFPTPLKEVQVDTELPFALHLFFKINNKMVAIVKAGEVFNQEAHAKFVSKGLNYVYILKKERDNFYEYKSTTFSNVLKSDSLSLEKKQAMLETHTIKALKNLNEVTSIEESQQLMENCSGMTKNIITNVSSKSFSNLFDEINKMVKTGSGLMVHSANVSSLSVLFAMLSGVTDSKELESVAMGGLLHDLGLSRSGDQLASKYLDNIPFSDEDYQMFMKHPQWGLEMLGEAGGASPFDLKQGSDDDDGDVIVKNKTKKKGLDPNVKDIVFQHHENFDGSGFPRTIRGMQINHLAKIVRIANDFDIIYRKLVAAEKFSELSSIFSNMSKNVYPIALSPNVKNQDSQKSRVIYDPKLLSTITVKMTATSN
ncbi:MAG: HD domain-containing protein [Oligoflexia bacterium]|nr:HD domain-containing protein [Oligoflexia bacterium]